MATAGSEAYHQYPLKTAQQKAGLYWIRWDTNGTSNPDNQVGNTREITVTRISKNTYGIGFAHRWARAVFVGQPVVLNTSSLLLPLGKVEGYDADNGTAVALVDETLTLEAVESNGKTCEAAFMLSGAL
jgi:hypothetical protein